MMRIRELIAAYLRPHFRLLVGGPWYLHSASVLTGLVAQYFVGAWWLGIVHYAVFFYPLAFANRLIVGIKPSEWYMPNFMIGLSRDMPREEITYQDSRLNRWLSKQSNSIALWHDDRSPLISFIHQHDMVIFKIAFHDFTTTIQTPEGAQERLLGTAIRD